MIDSNTILMRTCVHLHFYYHTKILCDFTLTQTHKRHREREMKRNKNNNKMSFLCVHHYCFDACRQIFLSCVLPKRCCMYFITFIERFSYPPLYREMYEYKKKNLKHISIIKILLTLITKRSLPSTFTMTITINTPSMIVTAGNFTFVRRYVTFGSLPTFLTMTNAATIMTMRGTKYWTYAYDIVVAIYGFIIFFCVFGEWVAIIMGRNREEKNNLCEKIVNSCDAIFTFYFLFYLF